MDLFDKCRRFAQTPHSGLDSFFLRFEDRDGAEAVLSGRRVVMCGSNSYLGLNTDPRVIEASRAALPRQGTSCSGSRLLNGNLISHEELESELASVFGKQSALVFATGYQTNVGVVDALVGRGDTLLLDREAHASTIDGGRMSGARVTFFAHNDPDDLAARLSRVDDPGRSLVVVEGIYSMGGDICRLDELLSVCGRFGARMLVDDAHGAGVLGHGRGTCAQFDAGDDVDLITITFSKSFASIGGAVLGDREVIDYLRYQSRSQVFSAGLAPAATAAALTAVRIAVSETWRARRALAAARRVGHALHHLGFDVPDVRSPILPVLLPDVLSTTALWHHLLDRGVYANAVQPPAASPRIRMSFTAAHTDEQLARVMEVFAEVAADRPDFLRPTSALRLTAAG